MPCVDAERSIAIIKKYVERLGLDDKAGITALDFIALRANLIGDGHAEEAQDVTNMRTPEALQDFIVNTLYGDEP